jgi:trimethylguanosine synthase
MEGVVIAAAATAVVEKSPYAVAVDSYKEEHGWPRDFSNDKEVEKPKARVETTGLLPHIDPPDPAQRTKFGSSSSSDEEEELEGEPTAMEDEAEEEVEVKAANNNPSSQRKRRRGRQRKVRDQYGELVLPPCLHKYWLQRYSYFSKYDHGIAIDEEGWYSVTPEVIAWHHAKRLVASMGSVKRCVAVDAFGGMGGNSIQLALAGCHVISIEMDPTRASLLRHNAQVYGVEHLVEVICGDFLQVAPRIRADVVVLSPPWGGPEYSQKETFDVETMGGNPELGLSRLLELSFNAMGCSSALVWLPRSSSLTQVEKVAEAVAVAMGKDGTTSRCEAEIATLNGVTKAMTVYFGTAAKFRGPKQ